MHRRIVLVSLLLSACATTPAVSSGVQIAPDTRPSCAANCEKIGLKLAAVVLVRNSVGCVCAVPEARSGVGQGGEAVAGAVAVAGGVLIAEDEDAQQVQPMPPAAAKP
jgi:chemotaxis response regulator CheB